MLGTIETDGTVGTLATANVIGWNLIIDDGVDGPFTLNTGNSARAIAGNALSATNDELIFDFTVANSYFLFQNPFVGAGVNAWCLSTSTPGCVANTPHEVVLRLTGTNVAQTPQQGRIVVGSSANNVPEPTTLALLGLGLLGLGAMQRRQA